MGSEALDREATEVAAKLPAGLRLAVIGSSRLWRVESEETCRCLGRSLARVDGLVLLTGGVAGAGEAVGRSYWEAHSDRRSEARVFHILPRGSWRWDYGETLFAGSDMEERREILGRLAEVCVSIEGGPGTEHEASVARAHGAVLIPVGRSGGCSTGLYAQIPRPAFATAEAWRSLGGLDCTPSDVADAVAGIVRASLEEPRHGL